MFDPKSDYALNKTDPEAIVCKSATGVHIRLTREDFSSNEEFQRWKNLFDVDYKDRESDGRGFYDHSISLEEAWNTTGVSAEDVLLASFLKAEQEEQQATLLQQIKSMLTDIQYRRLWMYCVEKRTEAEIARIERVGQPRVCRSLCRAKKLLKNFSQMEVKQGIKSADFL